VLYAQVILFVKSKWLAEAFKPDYHDNKKPFLSDKQTRLLIAQHWS